MHHKFVPLSEVTECPTWINLGMTLALSAYAGVRGTNHGQLWPQELALATCS